MSRRIPWNLAVAAGVVLSLTVPGVGGAANPPTSRWQVSLDTGGTRGRPAGLAIERGRVIVAGTLGGDARGDGTDAAVHAYRRTDGAPAWSRRFASENTDSVYQMVATPRTVYVVGTASSINIGGYRSSSFVLALATKTGASRWESRSVVETPLNESFLGASLAGGRLFAVGSANRRILVRAYKASSGRLLWEDLQPESSESERATRVVATADRVYVVGDRDTVLGRSAPYVARAYDAATGEMLWENQFGQQVNNARGLALVDGILVVAGHYWDIGPGVRRMEIRGLDPESGEVLWSARPARSFSGSLTNALLELSEGSVVGGSVSRARTLPVLRFYDPAGGVSWTADSGDLNYGVVNALTLFDGTVVVAGAAEAQDQPGSRNFWLRGHDPVAGGSLWEDLAPIGTADSAALVLGANASQFAVAGVAESAAGSQEWVVRLYR